MTTFKEIWSQVVNIMTQAGECPRPILKKEELSRFVKRQEDKGWWPKPEACGPFTPIFQIHLVAAKNELAHSRNKQEEEKGKKGLMNKAKYWGKTADKAQEDVTVITEVLKVFLKMNPKTVVPQPTPTDTKPKGPEFNNPPPPPYSGPLSPTNPFKSDVVSKNKKMQKTAEPTPILTVPTVPLYPVFSVSGTFEADGTFDDSDEDDADCKKGVRGRGMKEGGAERRVRQQKEREPPAPEKPLWPDLECLEEDLCDLKEAYEQWGQVLESEHSILEDRREARAQQQRLRGVMEKVRKQMKEKEEESSVRGGRGQREGRPAMGSGRLVVPGWSQDRDLDNEWRQQVEAEAAKEARKAVRSLMAIGEESQRKTRSQTQREKEEVQKAQSEKEEVQEDEEAAGGAERCFVFTPSNNAFLGPLVQTPGGGQVYAPYTPQDISAIMALLPPLNQGGQQWLRKLTQVTQGTTLCMGDIRALLGRAGVSVAVIGEMENRARSDMAANNVHFANHRARLGDEIRQTFPTQWSLAAGFKVTPEPGEGGMEFAMRSVERWEAAHGETPQGQGGNHAGTVFFRQAVLNGLPASLRERLLDNPSILTSPHDTFITSVAYALDRHNEKTQKSRSAQELVTQTLAQLQLKEAQDRMKIKKEDTPTPTQDLTSLMYQQQPQPLPFPQAVPHAPMEANVFRPRYNQGQQRGGGGRGRGYRPQQRDTRCYNCGQNGHWARQCPMMAQQQQLQYQPPFYPPQPPGPYWGNQQPHPQQAPQTGPSPMMAAGTAPPQAPQHMAPNDLMAPQFQHRPSPQ